MDTILLTDPDVEPTDTVLEKEAAGIFPLLKNFLDAINSAEYKLSPEWRFYKDGKAWLCKICQKKKTVAWLSLWPGFFKLGFYFTDTTGAGIPDLKISESLKQSYATNKPSGRMKPLEVIVSNEADLSDAYTLIKYKAGTL